MKRKDQLKELRDLNVEALESKVRETNEELMRLRFRKAGGQLEEGHRIGEAKKGLARAMSILEEKKAAQSATEEAATA